MDEKQLRRIAKKMFRCDTVRVTKPSGRWFLVIGFKRSTRSDSGHDYIHETVIAQGSDSRSVLRSAREYKRLSQTSESLIF